MDYQKLQDELDFDDINMDDIDVEDLLQEHPKKPMRKHEIKEISIGNGKCYYVDADKTSTIEKNKLAYGHIQILIQIFIELRNALGYTSKPPHTFGPIVLAEAIKTLQIEYAKVYGILFNYGYKIIKANPLQPYSNFRPLNILKEERLHASKDDSLPPLPPIRPPPPPPSYSSINTSNTTLIKVKPASVGSMDDITDGGDGGNNSLKLDLSYLNKKRFGAGCLKNSYTPLPQRNQRPKRERFVSEDAKPVTSAPRIYGNQQVRRRKKTRIPIIHDAPC